MNSYVSSNIKLMMHSVSSNKNNLMVSLIIPGFNEEAIVKRNLEIFFDYMTGLGNRYAWELLFINDGSTDNTRALADEFAKNHSNVRVINHKFNMNLGNALKTGFAQAKGDYVVTMDLDLSYDPSHIEDLVETLVATQADVVIASPYMKGGRVTAVPFLRIFLSRFVNRFMRMSAGWKISTFTGMVRGYRTDYIKSLNIKAVDYEINPEIIYESIILRARIVEIPAHLDWTEQNGVKGLRTSNLRFLRAIFSGLMSGFIFRPYIFFIRTGLLVFLLALYIIVWIFINVFSAYPEIEATSGFFDSRFSDAVSLVYKERPYSFLVGGITLMVSLIILAIGLLSLQSKRYFEELFHITTNVLRKR